MTEAFTDKTVVASVWFCIVFGLVSLLLFIAVQVYFHKKYKGDDDDGNRVTIPKAGYVAWINVVEMEEPLEGEPSEYIFAAVQCIHVQANMLPCSLQTLLHMSSSWQLTLILSLWLLGSLEIASALR